MSNNKAAMPELCSFCARGYLVAEYSTTEKKTNYYCNSCFKYKKELSEVPSRGSDFPYGNSVWEHMSEEEIDEFLDGFFVDYLN